ncbi:hypothetical protein OUZ56_017300 [Daphnia magna]|uniref:Uncharacterized protein n=1 Tax=Daphnia magna TaxID=35525 RepID=A0ABR0ASM2_9CRUS|nr:hypothetical protein OUZ56_017300 [Daphnia magna]
MVKLGTTASSKLVGYLNRHHFYSEYFAIKAVTVWKGSNSRDGIKHCPESALDESPSGELPELGSVRGVPWFPKRSSDASPTFEYYINLVSFSTPNKINTLIMIYPPLSAGIAHAGASVDLKYYLIKQRSVRFHSYRISSTLLTKIDFDEGYRYLSWFLHKTLQPQQTNFDTNEIFGFVENVQRRMFYCSIDIIVNRQLCILFWELVLQKTLQPQQTNMDTNEIFRICGERATLDVLLIYSTEHCHQELSFCGKNGRERDFFLREEGTTIFPVRQNLPSFHLRCWIHALKGERRFVSEAVFGYLMSNMLVNKSCMTELTLPTVVSSEGRPRISRVTDEKLSKKPLTIYKK